MGSSASAQSAGTGVPRFGKVMRPLRRTLVSIMLATLVGVAVPTLATVAWMNYTDSQANLEWTRQQIREGLSTKGSVLATNHAIALRGLVVDNAFADVEGIVRGAVKEDPDIVYGLFLSADPEPWVFVAPGVDPNEPPSAIGWRVLRIDEATLRANRKQVRNLQLFGQEIFEFSMPVMNEDKEVLGTIRYGLSVRRTETALADARARSRRDLIRTLELLGGIVLAAMLFGGVAAIRQSRRITEPLLALTEVARAIASGDRDVRADVRSEDEIEVLGGAFNQMVGDLNESYRGLEEAKGKLQRMNETLETQVAERTEELSRALKEIWSEMDLAKKVQTVLLPQHTELSNYRIAATMMPADIVGGDYFDLIHDEKCDWLLIGDVSGHGVTAGLGMMMVQTAVRSVVLGSAPGSRVLEPSELLTRVNRAVEQNFRAVSPDQYMTISALRIEGSTITYAGMHESILVYRAATKRVERLQTSGMWIGLVADISCDLHDESLRLEEGDVCLLYTDGLTELVVGENKRRLGVPALAARFEQLANETDDVERMLTSITELAHGHEMHDDITAMILRYAPALARAAA